MYILLSLHLYAILYSIFYPNKTLFHTCIRLMDVNVSAKFAIARGKNIVIGANNKVKYEDTT